MEKSKKMGFLGKYIATNVNLADPAARTKWKTLIQQIIMESQALQCYEDNASMIELINIAKNDEMPDKLMAFGRNLDEFINTTDKDRLKEDTKIIKIVELYSETAIASNDKRAIDLATSIMKNLLK